MPEKVLVTCDCVVSISGASAVTSTAVAYFAHGQGNRAQTAVPRYHNIVLDGCPETCAVISTL